MESEKRPLVRLASGYIVHRREASFGGGRSSESGSAHTFSWSPSDTAFVRADKGEVLMGSWIKKQYSCNSVLAADILALCADEVIQKRFLTNYYSSSDDSELYCCRDALVAFHLHKAIESQGMSYYRLASFSFQFYAPDGKGQHIHLSQQLCQSLVETLKSFPAGVFAERLEIIAGTS